jgi:beta-glucosidase
MSDGPVGVRGTSWAAADPAITLPSPTALAATWDADLARQAGRLLGQEARRKGVHVLLAPTVNLHRSPLGGRHFECYSEDPLLTGAIGTGYVLGVQEQGVAATVKHLVANDFETERFTASAEVAERALRELYLAPFEMITREAGAWAVMSAYNRVNGVSMTEHAELQLGLLKGEWGFDGAIMSDWLAARDTVGAANGGLDIAMPAMAGSSRLSVRALFRWRSSTSRSGGCSGWPREWARCRARHPHFSGPSRPFPSMASIWPGRSPHARSFWQPMTAVCCRWTRRR